MTAPSIKEALKRIQDQIADLQGEHEVMVGPFDASQWKIDVSVADLQALLATFQPDGERREAIALQIWNDRLKRRGETTVTMETVRSAKERGFDILAMDRPTADAILASGLVQDEAGIRADERKKLRNRLDSHLNDFLCGMKEGWDDSVSGFNDAWDVIRKVFDAAAIRSARNGGAS